MLFNHLRHSEVLQVEILVVQTFTDGDPGKIGLCHFFCPHVFFFLIADEVMFRFTRRD